MALDIPFSPIDVQQGDWKVYTERVGWSDEVRVWLGVRQNGRFSNARVDKTGHLELTEMKEGAETPEPLMVVPTSVWQMIVDAVAEKTPPTKKEALNAELGATKFHLEDMRALVFKTSVK